MNLPPDLVTALYTCHACGDKKVKVHVKKRRPGQDIVEFTHQVANDCGGIHELRNPLCKCRKLDIHLPIAEGGVGYGEAIQVKDI